MTTSSLSVTTDSSTSISTNISDGEKMAATSTMSQPTALPQGLVPGASQSRPSSDNATSNSVINSSGAAATGAQGGDSPWLDSPVVSDWERQPGSSQPSTPRIDRPNNPVTTSQFTGWGTQAFPSTFSGDTASTAPASKWGAPSASNNNNGNMQSAWRATSTNVSNSSAPQQQPSSTSDWGMPTGTPSTTQWGMPSAPVTQAEPSSWGQPNMLPNAGTDGWGQTTASVSSGQANTPSSAPNAQPSQWGQPASHSSSSSSATSGVWQTSSANISSASNQSVQSTAANTSASTAQPSQWGATTSSAPASNPVSPPTTSSATQEAPAAPTSWAGAAAKGLPKSLPKPQEPVDPVKVAIEQSINNPDGWGRVPVKQDTSWGQPPDKNKQDESNQWHTTQNNGTAIWETSKNSNGPADKSTWNQKVAGSTDPNVWNGEGSKGNDNALWDNVPKEADNGDKPNTWNAQVPQPRTISGSSATGSAEGGNGSGEGGWAPNSVSANRSSPPNSTNQQQPTSVGPAGDAPGWSSQNGVADPRKGSRWDSNAAGQGPMRMNSMSGEPGYWDQGQGRSNGPPSNWNSKPSASWSGDSSAPGGSNWGHPQSAGGHGSWADGPSWQPGGSVRKPSYNWEDGQANGGDFSRDRRMKGDGEVGDDADMGDWNESNSVWSSARGFQPPRKHTSIPENHMSQQHMVSNRAGGNGHFGSSGMMNPGHSGMAPNANMGSKSQMLSYLVNTMKFPKDEAHSALINNNMNMEAAIAELNKNSSMQPMGGRGDFGAMVGGPIGDNAFNPNIPPPNMPTSALNTPFTTNAQHNQSAVQGSSRINKPPNQPRMPGRGGTNSQSLQQQLGALIKHLEMGVQMNNIHPHILHLPPLEHNLRIIQQLLTLQQSYQHQHELLIQVQRRHGPTSPQADQIGRVLTNINSQMKVMQQPLLLKLQQNQVSSKYASGLPEAMSGLSLPSMPNAGPQPSSSQSRLGLWTTDKTPGSRQGGMLGDNLWSTPGGSSASMWPNMNTNNQYLDNQNESHLGATTNGPHSVASNSSQSLDIPEFVPGVPWQGANSNKVEDDPNLTPGSVARSLSVSTASGRNSTDLGWSSNAVSGSKSTWSSQNPASPAADMWNKSTRPPPGFNKNINRSVSMPQGPSEKTSAFSPVGSASWDTQQSTSVGVGSPWLMLRNLPPQVDANTLKTLCLQHGPLQSFFVNTNTGQALIRYTTKDEALKAQKSLHSCSMFETTIAADFLDDNEVPRIIEQGQRQGSMGRSHSVSAAPGSAMWPSSNNSSSTSNLWASNVPASSSMWGGASAGFAPAAEMGGNNYNM